MKKMVLALVLMGITNWNIQAQVKQREELIKQIAAFKVYIEYAQKGYSIAKKGLNTIGAFKRVELNLHFDYFSSLTQINPKIKSYARVLEIISLQVKVLKRCRRTIREVNQDDLFHGDEQAYIRRVMDRLLANCDATLDELMAVLAQEKLVMKDDERYERIDVLYRNMLDSYSFCEDFSNQTKIMSLSRNNTTKDLKTSRVLQGVKENVP